jgi:hypothetical protein
MRFQDASLMLKPRNPCPVCGAETALAEIEPHPLHAKFEIHGYLCDRCGPIKSLVVLRSPPLLSMMPGVVADRQGGKHQGRPNWAYSNTAANGMVQPHQGGCPA